MMRRFKKEYIQQGMVVEFRNGNRAIVMNHYRSNEKWVLIDNSGFVAGNSYYNEDLTNISKHPTVKDELDVMVVYGVSHLSDDFLTDGLVPVWKREGIRDHSMRELIGILGYEFEIK
mgnify:FL=1